jgi:glutathione synthase/RimK-type ligase-like ATP-grasp enzyme
MKNIYLIVDNESFFAHHIKFGQLDKNIMIDYFNKYKIDLNIITLNELSFKLNIKNSIIITLSSQKPYHKAYIDDIYEYLALNDNILIPSKNMIKAHDNKGYQELYKKYIGLFSLKYLYINKDTINYENVKELGFPLVLKSLGGSGSKGVQLIQNELDLKKEINKLKPSLHIRYFIYLKEMFLNTIMRKYNLEKVEYFKDYDNYVIQEFIPNLTFDYKVLVFFDKYYVLKRNISKDDFRASGSGKFEFVEIEDSLLKYTESIFKQFNEPFMSLDICFDGNDYYLIEYQGIHFGPYTQINAKGFYKKENNKWLFIEEKVKLEEDIVYSLFNHLKINYNDAI